MRVDEIALRTGPGNVDTKTDTIARRTRGTEVDEFDAAGVSPLALACASGWDATAEATVWDSNMKLN